MRYLNNDDNRTSAIIELKTFAGGATASAFGGIVSGQLMESGATRLGVCSGLCDNFLEIT